MNGISGLEVANKGADAPILYESYNDKVPHHTSATPWNHWQQSPPPAERRDAAISPSSHQRRARKRFCGLAPTTFCLGIALAIAIVLGVVGIGVAAAFAVKTGKDKANSEYATARLT